MTSFTAVEGPWNKTIDKDDHITFLVEQGFVMNLYVEELESLKNIRRNYGQ